MTSLPWVSPCAGRVYRPNVVRVGSDSSVAPAVKERLLSCLVGRYRDMPQPEWQQRCADAMTVLVQCQRELAVLEAALARAQTQEEAVGVAGVSLRLSEFLLHFFLGAGCILSLSINNLVLCHCSTWSPACRQHSERSVKSIACMLHAIWCGATEMSRPFVVES